MLKNESPDFFVQGMRKFFQRLSELCIESFGLIEPARIELTVLSDEQFGSLYTGRKSLSLDGRIVSARRTTDKKAVLVERTRNQLKPKGVWLEAIFKSKLTSTSVLLIPAERFSLRSSLFKTTSYVCVWPDTTRYPPSCGTFRRTDDGVRRCVIGLLDALDCRQKAFRVCLYESHLEIAHACSLIQLCNKRATPCRRIPSDIMHQMLRFLMDIYVADRVHDLAQAFIITPPMIHEVSAEKVSLVGLGLAFDYMMEGGKNIASYTMVGSPLWCPPEVLMYGAASSNSDVWGIGFVVIWLIGIEWEPCSQTRLLELYSRGDLPKIYWEDTHEGLRDFILSCLIINHEKRPSLSHLRKHLLRNL